jgi:hypothetical protein
MRNKESKRVKLKISSTFLSKIFEGKGGKKPGTSFECSRDISRGIHEERDGIDTPNGISRAYIGVSV